MKFFIDNVSPESVSVLARAEDEGGIIGDLFQDVDPGQTGINLRTINITKNLTENE